jgi:sulfate permease, SulP family
MLNRVAANCPVRHVILMCGAVNEIDLSALEALEAINTRFISMGVGFHLSEVKGPVMDRMRGSELLAHLNGRVFLTQYQAWTALTKPA